MSIKYFLFSPIQLIQNRLVYDIYDYEDQFHNFVDFYKHPDDKHAYIQLLIYNIALPSIHVLLILKPFDENKKLMMIMELNKLLIKYILFYIFYLMSPMSLV
jgi:hypothetical protein